MYLHATENLGTEQIKTDEGDGVLLGLQKAGLMS